MISNRSRSGQKRDPDQRLHCGRLLPGQHVRGRAGEHGGVRLQLHQARAEREAAGQRTPPELASDPPTLHGGFVGADQSNQTFVFLIP